MAIFCVFSVLDYSAHVQISADDRISQQTMIWVPICRVIECPSSMDEGHIMAEINIDMNAPDHWQAGKCRRKVDRGGTVEVNKIKMSNFRSRAETAGFRINADEKTMKDQVNKELKEWAIERLIRFDQRL